MKQCEHKWVFQENQHKTRLIGSSYSGYDAEYMKNDIYYCEKCCEIKMVAYKERVQIPRSTKTSVKENGLKEYAPIWYLEEHIIPEHPFD